MRLSATAFAIVALLTAGAGGVLSVCADDIQRETSRLSAVREITTIANSAAAALDPENLALGQTILQRVLERLPSARSLWLYVAQDGDWVRVAGTGENAPPRLTLAPAQLRALENGAAARSPRGGDAAAQDPSGPLAYVLAPVRDGDRTLRALVRATFDPLAWSGSGIGLWLWFATIALGALAGLFGARALGAPMDAIRTTVRAARTGPPPALLDDHTPAGLVEAVRWLAGHLHDHQTTTDERVRQRTRELEQSARQRDEFIANTVHELRTPLTTILASVDMVRDGYAATPEDQREFLEQASVATRHLMFLVNDLLDAAAIEAGKLHIEGSPVFVRELVEDAERLMRPAAIARGLEFRVEPPDGDPLVLGDRTRILQVLFNLLSNAFKYTPPGGSVLLRCSATAMGAAFEVEDDGAGVPFATRSKLFTRFGRAHQGDQSTQVSGTGIGLYLCKALVEQMRGSIGYQEREPGPGSVFWFTLPVANPKDAHPPAAPVAATGPR